MIGAAVEVHRHLGPGFLESMYEEALCAELASRGIAFRRQVPLAVHYKASQIGAMRLDLVVDDLVIVELKAVEAITALHTAQLYAYLKATRLALGLLINFNVPLLRTGIKRVIMNP